MVLSLLKVLGMCSLNEKAWFLELNKNKAHQDRVRWTGVNDVSPAAINAPGHQQEQLGYLPLLCAITSVMLGSNCERGFPHRIVLPRSTY